MSKYTSDLLTNMYNLVSINYLQILQFLLNSLKYTNIYSHRPIC